MAFDGLEIAVFSGQFLIFDSVWIRMCRFITSRLFFIIAKSWFSSPTSLSRYRFDKVSTGSKFKDFTFGVVSDPTTGTVLFARFHCVIQLFVCGLILWDQPGKIWSGFELPSRHWSLVWKDTGSKITFYNCSKVDTISTKAMVIGQATIVTTRAARSIVWGLLCFRVNFFKQIV